MYELLGTNDGSVWISRNEGRILAEIPTGFVLQNDDCRDFRHRFHSLFNRNRSLEKFRHI